MSELRTPSVFDAAAASRLDDAYSTAAIREQRVRFRKVIAARPGEVGLDVGCGPGHLVCELAREVAPGGHLAPLTQVRTCWSGRGAELSGRTQLTT